MANELRKARTPTRRRGAPLTESRLKVLGELFPSFTFVGFETWYREHYGVRPDPATQKKEARREQE